MLIFGKTELYSRNTIFTIINITRCFSDEKGFVVTQTSEGLEVTIADDDTKWLGTIPADYIKYDDWIYFGIVWSSRTGLQLGVGGESVGILVFITPH